MAVLATQDIRSQKRRLKGRVVVIKQALFERMAHVASTGGKRLSGKTTQGNATLRAILAEWSGCSRI
jgi:hypothetical protein